MATFAEVLDAETLNFRESRIVRLIAAKAPAPRLAGAVTIPGLS
jgi:hypothetical protein